MYLEAKRKPVCGFPRLCLWAVGYGNTPEGSQAKKAQKLCLPSGEGCVTSPSTHTMGHLFLRLFPQWINIQGKGIQNASAIEMYASLTGMTTNFHSNAKPVERKWLLAIWKALLGI